MSDVDRKLQVTRQARGWKPQLWPTFTASPLGIADCWSSTKNFTSSSARDANSGSGRKLGCPKCFHGI